MGWVKHFFDGTSYLATDEQIDKGLASWRNSRFEGLRQVDILNEDNIVLSLKGMGEFWQSDTMEVVVLETSPTVLKRRVQKRVSSRDILYTITDNHNTLEIEIHCLLPATLKQASIPFRGYDIGKWLTLEYDTVSGHKRYYLSDVRI